MAKNIIYENYTNIYHFMDKIESRTPNGKFNISSQKEGDGDWNGTRTYGEALELFSNGIPAQAEKLKELTKTISCKGNINTVKPRPKNYYYGYSPNVPAAIIGLPKSMRMIERNVNKVKAISIYYDGTCNCMVNGEELTKAGETVFSLVYLMELNGYRVQLDYGVFAAREEGEECICNITLKEWKQGLDALKLSFPLTSPAMFRRFGFKWAEVAPGVTKSSWRHGYGRHLNEEELIKSLNKVGRETKNTYVVTIARCRASDYDPIALAKQLGISL